MLGLLVSVGIAVPLAQDTPQRIEPPAPAAATFDAWTRHIRPAAAELRWESIPWRATFVDGLRAADAAGRPLLFWAMNGHPLGCT